MSEITDLKIHLEVEIDLEVELALEVELDDACSHLIVRRQPTANDLRTVMATIKIITDLERVGDEATKIARTAIHLHKRGIGLVSHYETVSLIAEQAMDQLRSALDSFARLDDKQAAELIKQDERIDHGFRSITRSLITFMMEDPRTISGSIDTLWVAKAIERIGDHATNVAEMVYYAATGQTLPERERGGTQQQEN